MHLDILWLHICIYIYIHVKIDIYIRTYIHIYIHIFIHLFTYTYIYVCKYTYTSICMYIYIYMEDPAPLHSLRPPPVPPSASLQQGQVRGFLGQLQAAELLSRSDRRLPKDRAP